jgi:hypothetical protein
MFFSINTSTGFPAVFAWLMDRLEGKPVQKGCKTITVEVDGVLAMSASEQKLMLEVLLKDLWGLLGTPL